MKRTRQAATALAAALTMALHGAAGADEPRPDEARQAAALRPVLAALRAAAGPQAVVYLEQGERGPVWVMITSTDDGAMHVTEGPLPASLLTADAGAQPASKK